ncbi:MAG: hypothetical protein M0R03_22040 [Novosphingobium sp.]|jgi:hypothetical protein|nr:hypothetical protein [Novosphingobium sp.]
MIRAIKYIKANGEELELDVIDMQPMSIIEDLYNPYIHGSIVIQDRDSWQKITYSKNDEIEFEISKPIYPLNDTDEFYNDNLIYRFQVYKIVQPPIDMNKRPFRSIIIHFTAGNIFNAYNTTISKMFKQRTFTEISKELLNKVDVASNHIDITKTKIDYCSPSWSPIKIITDLSDRVLDENNNGAFVFFQDLSGIVNFITIPSLFAGKMGEYENTKYYDYASKTIIEENHSFNSSNNNRNKILTLQILKTPNFMKLGNRGMYGTNFTYFDLDKNELKTIDMNITDKKLSGKIAEYINIDENDIGKYLNNVIYVNRDNIYASGIANTKMNRLMMDLIELQISVPGYIDRKVGQIIDVEVPAQLAEIYPEQYSYPDAIYSGKYLIRGINHTFYPREYLQTLNVVSNGINSDINGNVIKW